jgi:REP element-mobilizing transposase RayT
MNNILIMDDKFAERYRVDSSRLKNWDYSSAGNYFVTVCTYCKNKFLGKIENGEMILNQKGKIVLEELENTIVIRKNIRIKYYVIMPNHVHLLIERIKNKEECVETNKNVETHCNASLHKTQYENKFGPQKDNLASIVRGFKSAVQRKMNKEKIFFGWQPRYYDEVVFERDKLFQMIKYIKNNPKNWDNDEFNKKIYKDKEN